MTDLFQDTQQRAGEDLQTTDAIDERDGNAPSLLAGSSTLPITESHDTQTNPESLIRTTDSTAAPARADNVESGQVGTVVGVNDLSAVRTPLLSPAKPDSETNALFTQVKGMIPGRTGLRQCERPGCILGHLHLVSRSASRISAASDHRPCP